MDCSPHIAGGIDDSSIRGKHLTWSHLLLLALVFLLCIVGRFGFAQAPVLSKIDPPNWWTELPDPVLLVQGEHLQATQFFIKNSDTTIDVVRTSPNGRWAFLKLGIKSAKPGSFLLEARNSAGATSIPYTLAAREKTAANPQGFSSEDTIYLIMTDRFADGDPNNNRQPGMTYDRNDPHAWHGGDLRGIRQHLDYLQDLGINTVWITPVDQNREQDSYHGYGATDMYKVDEHFGALADLTALANNLHARGMKLVLDIVPNHVGPAHPWVEDSPTPDWFHGTKAQHRLAQGNFRALMDPDASARDRQDVLDGWFVDLLPDMNQENPLVAQYLIQNTIWWIEETSADGLRLDTFPYVGRQFWHDFHAQLSAIFPRLTTVGEVFNGTFAMPPMLNSFFAGGVVRSGGATDIDTGLYTPFDYPFFSVIRDVTVRNAPMTDLANLFRQDSVYPHPDRLVTLLGSHDTKRFMSEPGATPEKLLLAFGVLLTARGTPVIYSGDEIGMAGGEDPDNRRDFPGGFEPLGSSTNAFFSNRRSTDEASIHDAVKHLLALRNSVKELQEGKQQLVQSDEDTIAYVRGLNLEHGCAAGQNRILVLANKSDTTRKLTVDMNETAMEDCTRSELLFGDTHSVQISSHSVSANVAPLSLTVIQLR
jgi:neopullulanase